MFDATFPFQHSPSAISILGELGENRLKVNLTVSQGTKPSRTVYPILITTVNARPSGWIEFCVFYMEHADKLVIKINVLKIIQLLENKMTGVIKNVATGVSSSRFPESFERNAIVKIFAGMDLITEVHTSLIECVQDGEPSPGEFLKTIVD